MKKIRILHVIGTLRIGGAENVAVNLYRNIDKDKYEMDYLVYDEIESKYTEEVRALGGKVLRFPEVLDNRFQITKKLCNIMRENGPYDVVHSHLMFHNGYVMKAAKLVGISCRISHAHSTRSGKNESSIIWKMYMKSMQKNILKYATKCVACGKEAGYFLYGKENFDKLGTVINNRIDAKKYQYSIEKKQAYRDELNIDSKYTFLMVGHLIPLKNHMFFFKVFKELVKYLEDVKLLVLGEGELKQELIDWVKENELDAKISFTGNVNNVNEYMIASDYLVMPSLYEGLPVTLVEAQAAGLRCFVSKNITDEADFSGLFVKLDIDASINDSKQVVLKNLHYDREDKYQLVKDKDYDICNFSSWLNAFYLTQIN